MGLIRSFLSTIANVVIFVFILLAVNVFALFLNDPFFHQIVGTVNGSIGLILLISLLSLLTDIFRMLKFPFNTPWPLFKGAMSVFMTTFVLRIIVLLGGLIGLNLKTKTLAALLYPIVFIFVVATGYWHLFSKRSRKPRR